MATIEELANKYGGENITSVDPDSKKSTIDLLADKYGGKVIENNVPTAQPTTNKSFGQNLGSGLAKGVLDVGNTLQGYSNSIQQGLGSLIGSKDIQDSATSKQQKLEEFTNKTNQKFDADYGDSYTASGGRLLGQVAVTAPMLPAKVITGIKGAFGALPIVTQAGERIAAPWLNRMGASVAVGGLGGAEYGATTSSQNNNGALRNTLEGAVTGAVAGPVLTQIGMALKGLPAAAAKMWVNVDVRQIAESAGIDLASAKNVIERLADAGYTPQSAAAELSRIGPNAMTADLSQGLTNEAGALAQKGGKATEILKGRAEARGETANNQAVQIMEQKLGPKPDIEQYKNQILIDARKEVKPDYEIAHKSDQKLHVYDLVGDINSQLESAVGEKQSVLQKVKGYLYKTVKDENGGSVQSIKNSVKDLHEVRQGIDDIINKRSDSLPPNALRAVQHVRDAVDAELKKVDEMASADAKFSEKMKIKEAAEFGEKAFENKTTIEQFRRAFDAATPEQKEALKVGMHSTMRNLMESAQNGELAGAQRLFGKKSLNRMKFNHAFGQDADSVMEALKNEAIMRGTEKGIQHGSQTAANLAIQERYKIHPGSGVMGEFLKGAAYDTIGGTHPAASSILAVKRFGANQIQALSENKLGRYVEGTADLLSRQSQSRDVALNVLDRVKSVQDRLESSRASRLNRFTPSGKNRIPVTIYGATGEQGYKQIDNRLK
jgi:hypothetical protein